MSKSIVTVTGPSGSGKTELVHELCANHPFSKLVSVTTRPMRNGEIEGKDYYFITDEEFTEIEQRSGLIQATEFNGYSYGTTAAELERISALGRVPIVIVEPTGIPQFQHIAAEHGYRLRTVFMDAERTTLIERYLQRVRNEPDSGRLPYHARRIAAIPEELSWSAAWDFDMRLFNNADDLSQIGRFANHVGEFCGCESRDAA